MRIRNILICVLTSLLCLGFFCPKAANAAQTPQEFVKGFYEWYIIKHYEVDDILEEEKLPEYVDDSLIAYLKRRGPSDIYYFIQFGSSTMAFKGLSINNLEKMLSFWYAFLQWRQAYEREIMGSV